MFGIDIKQIKTQIIEEIKDDPEFRREFVWEFKDEIVGLLSAIADEAKKNARSK